MSSSLVRKALEVVETETANNHQPSKKPRKTDRRNDLKAVKKRNQAYGSRILGDVKSNAALQVELARQMSCLDKDRTSENLKKLVVISSSKSVDYKRAQKIFDQTVKTMKPVDDTPQNSSSVFSEEDFKKFEEEYFVS